MLIIIEQTAHSLTVAVQTVITYNHATENWTTDSIHAVHVINIYPVEHTAWAEKKPQIDGAMLNSITQTNAY